MICEDMDTIEWLEKMMSEYEKVFLVLDKNLYKLLSAEKCTKNKILFLPLDDSLTKYPKVSSEDSKQLHELYNMYEFSDRFQVLSRNECFGNLLNLVDTGVLTREELVEALI